MTSTIKELLKNIGLTNGEIDVYLALFELDHSTTGKITKLSGISSSKVYEVLQRLTAKGLTSYHTENGVKYYYTTPAERLIDHLEEKKECIESAKVKVKKIIPALEAKRNKETKQETTVYRCTQGPKIVLREAIAAAREKQPVFCYDPLAHEENSYNLVEAFKTVGQDKNIKILVSNKYKQEAEEKQEAEKTTKSKNTEAKEQKNKNNKKDNKKLLQLAEGFLPPQKTIIYGDKVATIETTSPVTTIIIEKPNLVSSYKERFKSLWDFAQTAN